MPNRFCAVCGKSIGKNDPHYGMCLQCYLKENPLFELPAKYSLNICIDCGSFAKKDLWIEPETNEIFSTIEQALQKDILQAYQKKNNIDFSISFDEDTFLFSSKDLLTSLEVSIHGISTKDVKLEHTQIIKVNLNYTLCKNCTNLRGGTYFLSIIQLRVKDENQFELIKNTLDEINEFVETLFEKDHRQYISKMVNQKYGVDLYLSTNELLNYLLSFLKSKYYFLLKRSKKLVGRDIQRGKNIYRLKALIKFLPVSVNDTFSIEDQNFRVENITKNKVIIRDKNNTKLMKDYSYFFNDKLIKNED
ncbi:MAG: NMD3-related protein [Candidatus Odinarchaeota archaeon]